ncbi:LysR family transcriptional regulator [Bythopirellula goksoeyrii]|uniref:Hydrogen peroxide-inducible genes activator n=1 Tax=Bythopirellula goksoeyrii TaxID=1400387 RepID=A0A5B9QI59_9BACT|nr:LysR family transcriptional regulator [Bythopirellula goksoeyrii]QEG37649.1 Hydrogen peroxide-inducible genes activator [Bythopirellula goksoeyrii]
MHIKSLKIYCDIVERRSFSRAADDNGISQSNASQVVHQLEERLGAQLLDRSKRPFVLTPEGKRFFEGCRQIVREYDELENDVRTLRDASAGRLLVASIYSVGLAHMSLFMRQFSAKYPSAQVRLEYLHPDRVLEVVEQGDVDLGLVSYPEETRTLAAIPWRDEAIVLVCHPNHRFATERSVNFAELSGESLVAFEEGLRIRAEIDRLLMVHDVDATIAFEFDNIETMKRAIEINEGISLLPEPTVAKEIASGTLVKVPLEGEHHSRPLGIVHRRDRPLRDLARNFVELLQADSEFSDRCPVEQTLETASSNNGNNHWHQSAPAR